MSKTLDPQNLLNYIKCLAYVYHPDSKEIIADSENDSKYIKQVIQGKDLQQIDNVLPAVSSEFNVSNAELQESLSGSQGPLKRLLSATKLITSPHDYKLLKARFMPEEHKHVQEQRVKPAPKIKPYRTDLKNYLSSLAYLQHKSVKDIANSIGESPSHLSQTIFYKPNDKVINILQQVPFILDTSRQDIEDILKGDFEPCKRVLVKYNKYVTDQHSLRRYINAIAYMYGTNIKKLSLKLGHSENYIGITIKGGTGNLIAKLFDQLANALNMPNVLFMSALARSNAKIAGHAYLARMYFIVHYRHSPIQYKERHAKHLIDHKRISRGFTNVSRTLYDTANQKHLRKALRQIIKGWSNIFGFDAKDFISDNFINFKNWRQQVKVRQDNQQYTISNNKDWLVILKKIHHQLKATKHAFNLSELQKSAYRKYIYIGNIGRLDNPEVKNARRGLANLNKLGHDRYTFVGSFENTGIKVVRHGKKPWQEYYRPLIELKNVKYNGKIITKHVWFNYSKSFIKLGQLEPKDLISFSARVHKYYVGHITKRSVKVANYDLHYPTQVRVKRHIHIRVAQPVPTELHALIGYCLFHNHTTGYDFSYRNYQYIRQCITAYKKWHRQNI